VATFSGRSQRSGGDGLGREEQPVPQLGLVRECGEQGGSVGSSFTCRCVGDVR